jgi:hypothetical protein
VYSFTVKRLTLVLALLAVLTAAHADGLRAQIEASNKIITTAMKKKDFATLAKEMKAGSTADFKYTENGQTQNLDQMLQGMKGGLSMMNKLTVCTSKLITLKQKGNTATGTSQHTMVGTVKGNDKKTHTMSFTGIAEDTYVKEGGKWKMASMTWKSQKQTLDGKPVPEMGRR